MVFSEPVEINIQYGKIVTLFFSLMSVIYKTIDVVEIAPQKGVVGKAFKKDAKVLMEHLAKMTNEEAEAFDKNMQEKG